MALGVIEECLRLCVDYAKNRKLWGQEIGQFQLIQLKLANMEVARMNVRNMLFRVIEASQTGTEISLSEASAIKWYCSQAATDVAMDAVQLFGGNGYMTEYRVEQLARDAKSLMIYAGSNEVQITHVAKGLLSLTGRADAKGPRHADLGVILRLLALDQRCAWALWYRQIAAADATLRLSALPGIGMRTRWVASSASSAGRPCASGPNSQAVGARQVGVIETDFAVDGGRQHLQPRVAQCRDRLDGIGLGHHRDRENASRRGA